MLYEEKITLFTNNKENYELEDYLNEFGEYGQERRLKRVRGEYLSEHKERFVELLVFFIATKDDFPKNFAELEALTNEENIKSVVIAKEAFEWDFVETLCSIKGDVPTSLLDEYAAILMKFGKSFIFKESKQDWYKQKNIKLPKSFDVKKKEYCRYPINFETYKSGKTLIIKEGIEIRK
jgi:hypothetical protein